MTFKDKGDFPGHSRMHGDPVNCKSCVKWTVGSTYIHSMILVFLCWYARLWSTFRV